LSIKNTQTKYFNGRVHGTSSETGLWFPNFMNIASAFGMSYVDMRLASDLGRFPEILAKAGPCIVDCRCHTDQEILPAQALKDGQQAGLHDMTPFLSDDELACEMIVKI
jgi:acetolactate synthase-1/2/3 large subunit